ncbi:MAG: alpha-D-ribose 1-methylphosphonate 5-triphosphate synthase subunit PhnH [Pseudomonadota bacterium]|jgi:alpha-D-ribose 1-methylphosphonate 5-triphosphate synthase subunit PhnH
MNAFPVAPLAAVDPARVARGFAEPVHASQRVFRALLDATARPGRIAMLPAEVLDGLATEGLSPAAYAALLALLDAETSVWLEDRARGALDALRFHTGVRVARAASATAFVAVDAEHAAPSLWARLDAGSDERPQDGATLLVDVPSLHDGRALPGEAALVLRGPGIETEHRLAVGGLDERFWQARAALAPAYPRGVELLLACGDRLAAVPRTTRVTVEG